MMRRPSAAELLNVWERAVGQPAAMRALLMLAGAHPDTEVEALARLSIGARDAQLLDLREVVFGSMLECLTRCAQCGDHVELSIGIDEIRVPQTAMHGRGRIDLEGFSVSFRLPDSTDLLTLRAGQDPAQAERELLARCVLGARVQDREARVEELPAAVVSAVTQRMAEADPQAEVLLDLKCPGCELRWQALFDIAAHLWAEIDAWAKRILHEVHALARAYGWPERDILAMSPTRRRLYLDLLGL